jgi:hypothetical protein
MPLLGQWCSNASNIFLERGLHMTQFINHFTQISILTEDITAVQKHLDYLLRELAEIRRKQPSKRSALEDAYEVCIQECYKQATEQMQKLHEKYIALCNLTHREIDSIEDGTIAMGLRLHGVQQLSWKDTAEQMGVSDIQGRCYEYLKDEDDIFLW